MTQHNKCNVMHRTGGHFLKLCETQYTRKKEKEFEWCVRTKIRWLTSQIEHQGNGDNNVIDTLFSSSVKVSFLYCEKIFHAMKARSKAVALVIVLYLVDWKILL